MKVLVLTLALVGCSLAMPVGVEQDHPRSVVPLVITDYSSVASKVNPEDNPQEVPKESPVTVDLTQPEENPAASEDKPETAPTPAAAPASAPASTADDTKPADDALVEKTSAVATENQEEKVPAVAIDNQEPLSNDAKPAEVPLQEEKVPAVESDAVPDNKKEPVETSAAEATSSQDAPAVKLEDAKVSDELKPIAPVALNAPKTSEKVDESGSSEEKSSEEVKEEQLADEKKVETEVKPAESEVPAAANPAEAVPLEKSEEQTAVEEVKKVAVPQEGEKDAAQESPVISRRRRGTEGKEEEKKKPTEVTKKEKDEKKAKADDTPVKNVEANVEENKDQETGPLTLDDPKPEEAASEVKPVEVQKPIEDTPEVKAEVAVNSDAAPSVVAEVNADTSQIPAQVDENKGVEASGEKKLELPKVEEEKSEKVEENTPQETKVLPQAVEKDVQKTSGEGVEVEKKTEEAVVVDEKKIASSDEVSADPVVEKQDGKATATIQTGTADKKPEAVADVKQSETKEGANVAESASS
jgi:hypothetical protein